MILGIIAATQFQPLPAIDKQGTKGAIPTLPEQLPTHD
jgi:hypothetical protein